MLKKKALAAILTAAFVLGIGGMVTESDSMHEHSHIFEPALAHAKVLSENKAPLPQTLWSCYFCGTTTPYVHYVGEGAAMRSREPGRIEGGIGAEKCSHKHYNNGGRHCWVWVEGVPPVENHATYYYCKRCNEVDTNLYKKGQWPTRGGCRLNNGGAHDWAPTGIVKTGAELGH